MFVDPEVERRSCRGHASFQLAITAPTLSSLILRLHLLEYLRYPDGPAGPLDSETMITRSSLYACSSRGNGQQLASSWENMATSMRPTTSHVGNSMAASSVSHSFIQMPPLMSRPGVFTLSHMRDRASLPPFAQCLPGTLKTGGSKPPLDSVLGSGMYPPPGSGALHSVGMGSTGGFSLPLGHAGICGQSPLMESWHLAEGGIGVGRDGGRKHASSFLAKVNQHESHFVHGPES